MGRRNVQTILPLLAGQRAMLLETLRSRGGTDPGQIHVRCRLPEAPDTERFRLAWEEVVHRHSALRATVHWEELKQPLQVVRRDLRLPWEEWCAEAPEAPLNLGKAPVMRVRLDGRQLCWTCHHLLLDGWSAGLVIDEVLRLCRGEPLEPKTVGFEQFVRWVERRDQAAAEAFWRGYLARAPEPLPLPFRRVGERRQRILTRSLDFRAGRGRGITEATLIQGLWGLLLARLSGCEEVVVGLALSGRAIDLPGAERIVGMLACQVPLRVKVDRQLALGEWLAQIQAGMGSMLEFQHTAPADLQAWSGLTGRLFETLVVVETLPVPAEAADYRSGITSAYPVTLVSRPGACDLVLSGVSQESGHKALDALERLLDGAGDLDRSVGSLLATVAPLSATTPEVQRDTVQVAPAGATERRLAGIWEELFGRPVGVTTDFFALGGHSVLALQLMSRLESEFGRRLGAAVLLEHPTVRRLARVLEEGEAPVMSTVVPLNDVQDGPPLFLTHARLGNVLCYLPLARALDCPVFGIQAVGVDGSRPPLQRFEEMAALYLRDIKAVQPTGPYRLAGTTVGLELALQLRQAGDQVALLVFFDGNAPLPGSRWQRARLKLAEFLTLLRKGRLLEYLRDRKARQARVRSVREQARDPLGKELLKAHTRALRDYRARPYSGEIVLIRSAEFAARVDKERHLVGWGWLAGGGLTVRTVPGRHDMMLEPPVVHELAAQLMDLRAR